MICSVLAKRMSGCGTNRFTECLARNRPDGCAVSKQCRLRIESRREIIGRSFEAERAEPEAKGVIHLFEYLSSFRKRIGQILSHSRLLRALSGKQQHDFHSLEANDHR